MLKRLAMRQGAKSLTTAVKTTALLSSRVQMARKLRRLLMTKHMAIRTQTAKRYGCRSMVVVIILAVVAIGGGGVPSY